MRPERKQRIQLRKIRTVCVSALLREALLLRLRFLADDRHAISATLERIMCDMKSVPFKDEVWPKFLRETARKGWGLSK